MTIGIYKDVLTIDDTQASVNFGWKSNRIVSSCDVLIASLMKGTPDVDGILYLAIGEGDSDWDGINPPPPVSAEKLHAEILRTPVNDQKIGFIDDLNQPSASPTNRLEIKVDFIGSDIVSGSYQSLREFGLFGGLATDVPNSGSLINYVIHPRIDLTPNATLKRELRITFDNASHSSDLSVGTLFESAPAWLRESSTNIIDGVGDIFSTRLASRGIHTVEALCRLETSEIEIEIPPVKLLEFRTKARIALETMANFQSVSALQESSVNILMSTSVADLAIQAAEPAGNVQRMMDQLGELQVAVDDSFLRNKSLSELVQESSSDS